MTSPNLAYKSFDNENLHGPFYPENIRENEMVHAKLSKETDLNNYKDYRVWRISPLGVELVIEETDQLMKGIDIQLELTIGHQAALLKGLVVDNIVEEAGQKIAHIRLVKQSEEQDTSLEKIGRAHV